MFYIALLLLTATFSTVLYADTEDVTDTEDETQKMILRVAIFKNKPKSTWMNCNYNVENQTCAWAIGPIRKTLTGEEPPNPQARHKVEISNTSNSCVLRINNINFGDEGIYECLVDDDPPKYRVHLMIQGNPGPPVISFANGTVVWDDMIAVDETPAAIPIKCLSSGARPKHKRIYWVIDGKVMPDSKTTMTGPIAELWDATTEISVTFNEEEENNFVVKSVTCVAIHATGQARITKLFGIRNPNDTLHFEHFDLEETEHGKLRCDTHLFPKPSQFQIVKLKDHPNDDDSIHEGQEMFIKHTGRYVCRAGVETYRSSTGEQRTYDWLESEIIEVEGEPEEVSVSFAPTMFTAAGSVWRRMLEIFIVTGSLLILNWVKI